jgi:hypothetical protein
VPFTADSWSIGGLTAQPSVADPVTVRDGAEMASRSVRAGAPGLPVPHS